MLSDFASIFIPLLAVYLILGSVSNLGCLIAIFSVWSYRKEIGYDGWRLDFVRGFWGGYVKDYIDASEPYFAVGEYWDSLSYTYGEMDHNQDAHRQRIVDWINATNGAAGAFDVTTKGILHSVSISSITDQTKWFHSL